MEQHDTARTQTATEKALGQEVRVFVKWVAAFLLVLTLGRFFVAQSTTVQGPSMLPTLKNGERILVFKGPVWLSRIPFSPFQHPLKEGDLVVFREVDRQDQRFVKRVVAAGPPHQGNHVAAAGEEGASGTIKVMYHKGEVFVNNRRIEEPYLPAEERQSPDVDEVELQAGQYYVLGDHRSVSRDSRRFGPIDKRQIVGKAVWRIWPLSEFGRL
jgi:signal peptidase I